ncbi:hypothetical protein GCM10025771_09400 [Niveibacterium umoris]|uniref:TonB family protein n=1 Tax=Niveibacterium umoris TaxID=1193620 RepID=A0A840BIZ2_9RHOO|nr:TonB family protein [Niveibacterium umoris]MBB4013511.1 TonB family protein [Niveibacterium umoris]
MKSIRAGREGYVGQRVSGKHKIAALITAQFVIAVWQAPALAQTGSKAMPQVMSESEVSEATRRQAEGPMRFILQMDASKEKKPAPAKEAKPASPPPAPAPAAAATAATVKPKAAAPATASAKPGGDSKPSDAPAEPAQVAVATPAVDVAKPAAPAPEAVVAAPPPQPTLVTMVEPDIAPAVKRKLRGAQSATVRFNVAADGSVADAEVLQVSSPSLRQPVLDAIKQWRYNPPGQVVPQRVELQLVDATE